ncbi:YpmP family protein [Rossellomorea aquimaris]|uniref:YpmP family protein n=1 Tax=Rossellomorea aquimaris TaxID=189382 RepID=UPI00215DA3DB|nr:YpmP family protein [Rossellomorea aquimaris]
MKKRIDTLLTKTIEFKSKDGRKIKILEVPVMKEDSPLYLRVNLRLHQFISKVVNQNGPMTMYSFREHLKRTTKWSEYEEIYQSEELKNNA